MLLDDRAPMRCPSPRRLPSLRIGLHLTSFLARGGRAGIAAMLARVAERAEQAGLHSIWPMDQLRQIERFGDPDEPMLEAYTVLGWIAGRTARVQLGALVTGGPYRNPERLLQSVETLDTVSGGRAWLGLGAGWDDDFYARAREQHPRILIGGGGERRTLRLVARYADACNVFEREDVARKLAVLREHCEAERRPYDAILKTSFGRLEPRDPERFERLAELGVDVALVDLPDERDLEDVAELAARIRPSPPSPSA